MKAGSSKKAGIGGILMMTCEGPEFPGTVSGVWELHRVWEAHAELREIQSVEKGGDLESRVFVEAKQTEIKGIIR